MTLAYLLSDFIMSLINFKNYDIEFKNNFKNSYNLATRYEFLNAITLTWNKIFLNSVLQKNESHHVHSLLGKVSLDISGERNLV